MTGDWTTEPSGRVMGFSVHDHRILGIEFHEGAALSLYFEGEDGGRSILQLEQPTEIVIEQYYRGSIAGHLYAWKVENAPFLEAAATDGGWNALFHSRYHDADAKRFAQKIISEQPGSYLVVLNCAYGGPIAAVCRGIRFGSTS